MHLGIHVVQPPSAAAPAALRASAQAAEALGYHSLWVGDRLIEHDPDRVGVSRPLDAIASLAFVAAITDRICIGTSVLVGPWYPPVLLARSLASVDQLSRGRLVIGLGAASSALESAAAGIGPDGLDDATDALIGALAACWTPGPTTWASPRARLDAALTGPLPVQRPRPPLLVSGTSPAALERAGRHGDGWHAELDSTSSIAATDLARRWSRVREAARRAERDPDELRLVVRVDLGPATDASEVAASVVRLGGLGADEVVLAGRDAVGLDEALATYAAVAEAVELRASA